MEMDYRSDLEMDLDFYQQYHPNGDIQKIIEGTKKSLLDKTRGSSDELMEIQERIKDISFDAIRRIAERLFSDERFVSNIFLLSLEIVGKIDITEDAKERLINNEKLLFSLTNVIGNILDLEDFDFEIKNIDVARDPEIPEWKPILINLDIKSDNFKDRLRIKHQIIKFAYNKIDEDIRKQIFIIGAI